MAEPTKTLYHGELRKLGPVAVTVVSEPLESTKQKGTFYVELQVEGRQRYYHPENDACLEFWRGRRGQTLTVLAVGAREEASFETEGEPAKPQTPASTSAAKPAQPPAGQRAPAPPRETVRQPAAAPAHGADDPLAAAKHHVARNLTLARIALKATAALAKDYAELVPGAAFSPEMEVAAFTSLLYGANASVPVARLPLDIDIKTLKERAKA